MHTIEPSVHRVFITLTVLAALASVVMVIKSGHHAWEHGQFEKHGITVRGSIDAKDTFNAIKSTSHFLVIDGQVKEEQWTYRNKVAVPESRFESTLVGDSIDVRSFATNPKNVRISEISVIDREGLAIADMHESTDPSVDIQVHLDPKTNQVVETEAPVSPGVLGMRQTEQLLKDRYPEVDYFPMPFDLTPVQPSIADCLLNDNLTIRELAIDDVSALGEKAEPPC